MNNQIQENFMKEVETSALCVGPSWSLLVLRDLSENKTEEAPAFMELTFH
jgi:hypothetical protein